MKKKHFFALALLIFLFPNAGLAEPPEWTQREGYWAKFGGKFEYGAINMLGGWTEIVTTPMEYADEDKSVLAGILVGIGEGFVYTGGGILNFFTSPIPVNIPIPNNGVDMEF